MQVIIITNVKNIENEAKVLTALFENGLEILHLRKPGKSRKEMISLISSIPQKFRGRLVLHSHHFLAISYGCKGVHLTRKYRRNKLSTSIRLRILRAIRPDIQVTSSFHSLSKLLANKSNYEYVFLSPIFTSISKSSHKPAIKESYLAEKLKESSEKVIALGGVDLDKIDRVFELGFHGCAFLGAIWDQEKPLEYFQQIKDKVLKYNMNVKQIHQKVSHD